MSAAGTNLIKGSCHCGAVQFTAKLTDGFRSARRCTCSYCRMRGAIAVSADLGGINITRGAGLLTVYQFNTNTAKHTFCRHCGIHSFYVPRSDPDKISVNARCLEGVDPAALKPTSFFDGRNWEEAFAQHQVDQARNA